MIRKFPFLRSAFVLPALASAAFAVEPLVEYSFNALDDGSFASYGQELLPLAPHQHALQGAGVSGLRYDRSLDSSAVPEMGESGGGAGSRDRLSHPDIASFTIMGWIKGADFSSQIDEARIFYWNTSSGGIDLRIYRGDLKLVLKDSEPVGLRLWEPGWNLEEWTFFAVTWDGRHLRGYSARREEKTLSQTEKIATETSGPISAGAAPLSVGSATAGARAFRGELDNIRLFIAENEEGALSADKIHGYFLKDQNIRENP